MNRKDFLSVQVFTFTLSGAPVAHLATVSVPKWPGASLVAAWPTTAVSRIVLHEIRRLKE